MTHPLSRKQMEVLKALQGFADGKGYLPSVRELAQRLGKSPTTVFQHLKALERKGYIDADGTAHGWKPTPLFREGASEDGARGGATGGGRDVDWVEVPLAGAIAAGSPIEAVEDGTETLQLPRSMVPEGAFALRVEGTSMIEDHILDGDLVLVRPQEVVRDGEVAVALLEDGSATLKRVYREKGRVRLQPANSAMAPIYADEVRIQGKVVGVWRVH